MLYVVPTPIGNLEDITLRALRILKECDAVLAEDTRTSSVLLKHYSIDKRTIAYHQHNEHKVVQRLVEEMKEGSVYALITDAGTPGISDPGFLIVRECVKEGVNVTCLPGATAFVPALVSSGIPCDNFCFEGFLPQKKGRQTKLNSLAEEERTMVFYESPHRIAKTLEQFAEVFGPERQLAVCRELSKVYEETLRGACSEVLSQIQTRILKGEIVIVVAGKSK